MPRPMAALMAKGSPPCSAKACGHREAFPAAVINCTAGIHGFAALKCWMSQTK